MKNNLGTILGGVALAVSLGNSYFLYDLSKGDANNFETPIGSSSNAMPVDNGMNSNPMITDPNNPMAGQPAPAPVPTGPATAISFSKMEHNFGTIKQDTDNPYEFEFTNTGKNPLVITDAKGSCGCTVPEFPKEPIAPGGKGKIKVVYSPGKQEGEQTKNVTVTANTEPQQTVLTIKANVKTS